MPIYSTKGVMFGKGGTKSCGQHQGQAWLCPNTRGCCPSSFVSKRMFQPPQKYEKRTNAHPRPAPEASRKQPPDTSKRRHTSNYPQSHTKPDRNVAYVEHPLCTKLLFSANPQLVLAKLASRTKRRVKLNTSSSGCNQEG